MAKMREYEETLVTKLDQAEFRRLERAFALYALSLAKGGRFFSVKGLNNKGRAALALTKLYRKEFEIIITVGIGDSWNDAPLLSVVNIPIQVQRPGGKWERIGIRGIRRVEGVGPVGWTRAIEKLLAGELSKA
jgi:mannosyl-3-phosphoglycerate phosphatase